MSAYFNFDQTLNVRGLKTVDSLHRWEDVSPYNQTTLNIGSSESLSSPIRINRQNNKNHHNCKECQIPCPRSLHAGTAWRDKFIVFGGYDGHSRLNDVFSFHFSTCCWVRLDPRDSIQPTPRDRHSVVIYKDSIVTFAGFDGPSNARINSMYQFDLLSCKWQELVGTGDIPSPRHSHSAVTYHDKHFIFGGFDGDYCSDFFSYDFASQMWSVVASFGAPPSGRYRSSCVTLDDSMILHGGHDGASHLQDTFIFNFLTNTWSNIAPSILLNCLPPPRDSHCAVIVNNSMVIFGGSNGRSMGDMYSLDMATLTWGSIRQNGHINQSLLHFSSSVGPGNGGDTSPSSLNFHKSTICSEGRFCHLGVAHDNCLYIFGGYDGSNRLNDIKRFRLLEESPVNMIPKSSFTQDLQELVNNEQLSDIQFLLTDGRRVYAHKILCIRCPYFNTMFTSGHFKETSAVEIPLIDVEYDTLLVVLEYLYSDTFDRVNISNALEVLTLSDSWQIVRLKAFCENVLFSSLTVDNAATIFHTADFHQAQSLKKKCLQYILQHFDVVSQTPAFEEMGRNNIDLVFEILHNR